MRKIPTLFVCALCFISTYAQVIVGDMNEDGALNVADITNLVNTVLGKSDIKTLTLKNLGSPNIVDNTAVVGKWRTAGGVNITFGDDGSCSLGEGYTYEYYPYQGFLLVNDTNDKCIKAFNTLKISSNYLLLSEYGSSMPFDYYYTTSTFVNEVTLSSTTAQINTGESIQLVANVLPSEAANKTLTWKSSSTSVATVDQTGKVTGIKGGTATITATTTDGTNKSATCKVTVIQLATSLKLSYSTLTIGKGNTFKLTATISPSTTKNKNLEWNSSNTSAVIDLGDGEFYAKAAGTSTITVGTTDGSGKKATCKVTVLATTPTAIELSNKEIKLNIEESAQLTATILPHESSLATIDWSSSNPNVATVDKTGKITAGSTIGETTITATIAGATTIYASTLIKVSADFVDLGLPSKTMWATCNLGANEPEDYGNYYAWGELSDWKDVNDWKSYEWYYQGSYYGDHFITKYCLSDRKSTLELSDDAAYACNPDWRMPTKDEVNELVEYCDWNWTTLNNVNGYMVTSKTNKNFIFLPATGYRERQNSFINKGYGGYYWSNSLAIWQYNDESAVCLYFNSENTHTNNFDRRYSLAIRAVRR